MPNSPSSSKNLSCRYLSLYKSYDADLNRKDSNSSTLSAKTDTNMNTPRKTSVSSTSSSGTTNSFSFLSLNKLGRRIQNSISFGNLRLKIKKRTSNQMSASTDVCNTNTINSSSTQTSAKSSVDIIKSNSCMLYNHVQRKIPTIYIDSSEGYTDDSGGKYQRYHHLDESSTVSESEATQSLAVFSTKNIMSFIDPLFVRSFF
jgi:hypothetical protein